MCKIKNVPETEWTQPVESTDGFDMTERDQTQMLKTTGVMVWMTGIGAFGCLLYAVIDAQASNVSTRYWVVVATMTLIIVAMIFEGAALSHRMRGEAVRLTPLGGLRAELSDIRTAIQEIRETEAGFTNQGLVATISIWLSSEAPLRCWTWLSRVDRCRGGAGLSSPYWCSAP